VSLTDLRYIEQQPNYKKHNNANLINWNKRELMYEAIKEIIRFQNTPYNFIPIYQIQELIKKKREKFATSDMLMDESQKAEADSTVSN
jgi:hypothetical protein